MHTNDCELPVRVLGVVTHLCKSGTSTQADRLLFSQHVSLTKIFLNPPRVYEGNGFSSHLSRWLYQNIRGTKEQRGGTEFEESVIEMDGAQGALWYVVMRVAKCAEIQKHKERRAEIKSDIEGKSSNHPLKVSVHIHKSFESWKLRHLHAPKLSLLPPVFLSPTHSENQRQKSDFHITDCYNCHYIPWFTQSRRGKQANVFSLFTSPISLSHTHTHTHQSFTYTLKHTSDGI